jgi:hypothetical protein
MNNKFYVKRIIKSLYFEAFILIVVFVNTVGILISTYTEDIEIIDAMDLIDGICLYFYISECILKFIGLGIVKYFEDSWNIFDLSMVIISLSSSVL